jgi:hypothetical protein
LTRGAGRTSRGSREIAVAVATGAALVVFGAMMWAAPDQSDSCEVYCGPFNLLGTEYLLVLAPVVSIGVAAFLGIQAIRKRCNRVVLIVCGTLLLVPPAVLLHMYLASR